MIAVAEQQRDGSGVGGGNLFRSVNESVGSVGGSFGIRPYIGNTDRKSVVRVIVFLIGRGHTLWGG